MIILTNSPARKLQIVLGAAHTTTAPRVYAAWVDHTTTAYTPDAASVASNGTTQTDVVAAPGANTQRQIKALLTELVPRLRHIELAGEPAEMQTLFVGGLKRLPVRYEIA